MESHCIRPRQLISIHAPREGSDDTKPWNKGRNVRISIHAPREGSDDILPRYKNQRFMISIHAPVRGATAISHKKSTLLLCV